MQERDRLVEDQVTVGVVHLELRGVAVAQQVDLHPVDAQRVVHLERVLLLLRLGRLLVGDVRDVGLRLAAQVAVVDEGRLEVVEVHREGLELVGVGPVPRVDGVVGGQRVGEPVALDDQHVAPVAEEGTGGQGQQQGQQGEVEQHVPELAQVAGLTGHRVPVPVHAVPLEDLPGLGECRLGLGVGTEAGHVGHPAQVARGAHRPGPDGLGVEHGARDHAPGQRDEEQQVDRRVPGGREDVEEVEAVQPGRQLRVLPEEGAHLVDADHVLRQEGTRDGPHRQQEEQDQGGAHRRERAPDPAPPTHDAKALGPLSGVLPRGRLLRVLGRARGQFRSPSGSWRPSPA